MCWQSCRVEVRRSYGVNMAFDWCVLWSGRVASNILSSRHSCFKWHVGSPGCCGNRRGGQAFLGEILCHSKAYQDYVTYALIRMRYEHLVGLEGSPVGLPYLCLHLFYLCLVMVVS